jgi:hypothetical protein
MRLSLATCLMQTWIGFYIAGTTLRLFHLVTSAEGNCRYSDAEAESQLSMRAMAKKAPMPISLVEALRTSITEIHTMKIAGKEEMNT